MMNYSLFTLSLVQMWLKNEALFLIMSEVNLLCCTNFVCMCVRLRGLLGDSEVLPQGMVNIYFRCCM